MIARFQLHAGTGRSWQVDPSSEQFCRMTSNDHRYLASHAKSQFEEKFDWWIIFDMDDGMSHFQGWSTGRTTPKLLEADRAYPILR